MKRAKTILILALLLIFIVLTIKDMGKLQDLTGKSFDKFTVLKIHGRAGSGRNLVTIWLCKCNKCGHEFTAKTGAINYGDAGCRMCCNKTHGMYQSITYKSWIGMKSRCNNPTDDKYHNYGGRGIRVCDEWVNSFETFLSDMGERPSKKYTLDRIEVNGDYKKSNCRWATSIEQANNKRNNTLLEFNGETLTQKQWCRRLNIHQSTLLNRLREGMSVAEAFTKPVRKRNNPQNYG